VYYLADFKTAGFNRSPFGGIIAQTASEHLMREFATRQ